MKSTTVYLPDETEANLQKLAEETGRSLEELIQEAIKNYLAARQIDRLLHCQNL
jgi:predicted transcriptional regulator